MDDGTGRQKEPLKWRVATVRDILRETPRVRTLLLDVPGWTGHLPGQHLDIRLTGEDGYKAQRSYSIASAPEDESLAITVELVDDGEVSQYLVGELRQGDQFEARGPIGGYFVWTVNDGGPLFLIGGGSGIVPLMSMLRHRRNKESSVPATLLYSSRSIEDLIYRNELENLGSGSGNLKIVETLTRERSADWQGLRGRIGTQLIAEIAPPATENPKVFICGSNGFVETASQALVELGYDPGLIKTERFGPSGVA